MNKNDAFDPVTFELIKNSLGAIADEMSLTIQRTAYSTMIREAKDCGTAICDAKGQLIMYGWGVTLHLCAIPTAMEHLLKKFGGSMKPDDVYILNDPYQGGMHLPDIFVFKPMFVDGKLFNIFITTGHQIDVGGRVPGSSSPDSTEIYQEGLRIGPSKLFDAGVRNEALWEMIQNNVRVPVKVAGDLNAQMSACFVAEKKMVELVEKYGVPTLERYFEELLNYSERVARQEIDKWPEGTYYGIDYVDGDGFDNEPIPIKAAVTIKGSEITVDFTGSAPQVKGAINCTPSSIMSTVFGFVRSAITEDVPNNQGYFRPIKTIFPKHSIVNPDLPAAVAARAVALGRAGGALRQALAQALPGRVPAEGSDVSSIRIGGYDPEIGPWVLSDSVIGTGGARPDKDAVDGTATTHRNLPIEVAELDHPVRYKRYAFREDSGGPGKYRGGLGLIREWELLGDAATVSIRSDRTTFPPSGHDGGKQGQPSLTYINPDGERRQLPGKCSVSLKKGDVFLHLLCSGGGYGNALEREVALVWRDHRDGKVSAQAAREQYGVVIDEATGEVDLEETLLTRRSMAAQQSG